jgi:hypothetical protein
MIADASRHSGQYGTVGFDEHRLLFDERWNSRIHNHVRHCGLLHVLCGLGQLVE